LRRHFEESAQLWNKKEAGYKLLVLSRLYCILHDLLLWRMQRQLNPFAYRQVLPARQYILEHCEEELSLDLLAGLCNLSVTHFRRLFKSVFHVSPIAYLQNLRLEKAKDLLQIRGMTLEEIAARIGFQSASYFIRFFKQHTGLTPRQYMRLY